METVIMLTNTNIKFQRAIDIYRSLLLCKQLKKMQLCVLIKIIARRAKRSLYFRAKTTSKIKYLAKFIHIKHEDSDFSMRTEMFLFIVEHKKAKKFRTRNIVSFCG